MRVLFSAQCRVDTCREQEGDGEIALGNKTCWPFRRPTGLNRLFSGKRIHTCLFTKAQITLLPAPFLYLAVCLSLSHAQITSLSSSCSTFTVVGTCLYALSSFLFPLLFNHWLNISLLISLILTSIHISDFSPPAFLPISSYLKSWCFIESCGSLTDKQWLKCCDTVIAEDSESCQLKTNY